MSSRRFKNKSSKQRTRKNNRKTKKNPKKALKKKQKSKIMCDELDRLFDKSTVKKLVASGSKKKEKQRIENLNMSLKKLSEQRVEQQKDDSNLNNVLESMTKTILNKSENK
ncbi:hypothetical protein M0813_19702 [Anaeramoeba flamelloides]|uniref:Uncharacterized protein n=1 Tax=Anaeramoeba flamelloides TaxID=1746091 RepID=A0AAV8A503_9EUKA|nr:hypothetical protein M0812_05533 [Anaeramoeba flamelloides]KAJ6245942.1 hypothetical protein M0813_19702 [Anaeramoeba flamelloides]